MAILASLHCAVCYEAAKKISTSKDDIFTFNFPVFFKNLEYRLQHHFFAINIVKSSPTFVCVTLFTCLLIFLYYYSSKKKLISGEEYGTSRWAKLKEIQNLFACNIAAKEIRKLKFKLKFSVVLPFLKFLSVFDVVNNEKLLRKKTALSEEKAHDIEAIKAKYENGDMLLTATEHISIYNYELNNNVLIVGGSGAGKTRGYVLPNLLQAHSSFVVTDPKGEIVEKIGWYLTEIAHYKLRYLNLDDKKLSSGYNPFVYIHRERDGWEERVLSLIETIIINTDGGQQEHSSDPFWPKGERLFMGSVISATVEAFPQNQCNMNTMLELIRMLEIEEERDKKNSDLDIFFECFAEKYGDDHFAVRQFREFRSKASGKTAKSIVVSVAVRLMPFNIKEISRIMSYDDMHLDRVGEEKTALFVVVPPIDPTFNFIAGMLFTQLFQELNYCATTIHKHDGQRLPVPCRFILDEFANTCVIPYFVRILSYARSLNIGITVIIQSIEQLKKMYEKEWGVIIDTCDTLLYLGKIRFPDTLEFISKLLGKGTFDKISTSHTKGRQSSTSTNNDKLGRELLDPAEVGRIPKDECLLFISGKYPFRSKKYNYENHKYYKYTSDSDSQNLFSYKPQLPSQLRPHREDEPNELPTPTVTYKQIVTEYGQEAVNDYLASNLINLDFDKDEELIINDGEREELNLFAEQEKEEQAENSILDSIVTAVIECKTDAESVAAATVNLINAELESPNSVDFDNVEVNDGEPSEMEEPRTINLLRDIEVRPVNLVLQDTERLSDEMADSLSDFAEALDGFDLSSLSNDNTDFLHLEE